MGISPFPSGPLEICCTQASKTAIGLHIFQRYNGKRLSLFHFILLIGLARRVKLLHALARRAVKLLHRPACDLRLLRSLRGYFAASYWYKMVFLVT